MSRKCAPFRLSAKMYSGKSVALYSTQCLTAKKQLPNNGHLLKQSRFAEMISF